GKRFGAKDLFDPLQNLRAGTAYLAWLHRRFNGDLTLMLAAYNAGEGAVQRYGNRVPPFSETRRYVVKVTALYQAVH
ncbi:lytic transglycosylase domain-containing protein, partial [Escherichia coli]|uniref:lytic transglycosylase domain-containing protein n=1 Tax=Escherichia coli TaxID=562 RepID=UPI001EDA845A